MWRASNFDRCRACSCGPFAAGALATGGRSVATLLPCVWASAGMAMAATPIKMTLATQFVASPADARQPQDRLRRNIDEAFIRVADFLYMRRIWDGTKAAPQTRPN